MPTGIKAREVRPRQALGLATVRPKRGFDARSVGAYVPGLTRKAFEKYGFSTATLLTDWATIVGADLAASTMPERLSWPKTVARSSDDEEPGRPSATLVLTVEAGRALDVQYRLREVGERINAYFGYRAVTSIKIRQTHALPSAAPIAQDHNPAPSGHFGSRDVESVADPMLRAALARMAHGIVMRRPA